MAKEPPRTITVSGNGVTTMSPDNATVQMSIVARSKNLDDAQRSAAEVTAKVLELTDDLDIDRNRVGTTSAIARPEYRWNREKEEQELRGYLAERQITVRTDDLDILGKLIEGAVAAGVNQVSPPQLDSSDRDEAHRKALKLAALDARENAEILAETLDTSLGDVISINSMLYREPPPGPGPRVAAMAVESDAAATYNPADLTFSATVEVVFALKD